MNRVERARQLDVLRGVPLDEWTRPSRCAGWSVHDVVRHVVQMNEVMVGTAAAARAGERYERTRGFDPKTTPSAWLAEAPAAEPGETLAAYERSTRAVIEAGDVLGADVLVGRPVGRQAWPRVLLHALFDAVVHERDVTEPLGRSAPAIPEQLPVVAYVLLVAARVACAFDREFAVRLDVGGQVLSVAVRCGRRGSPSGAGTMPLQPTRCHCSTGSAAAYRSRRAGRTGRRARGPRDARPEHVTAPHTSAGRLQRHQ